MLEGNDELLLDRLIHEPARLAIMTVLSAVKAADFVFLQRATGLTKGNLSSHLTKLEPAGPVEESVQGPRRGTALTGSPAPQSGDESFTTRVDRTANGHLQHSVHVSAGAAAADERATPDQRADAAQHSSKLSDLSGDHFDQHDRQAVKCRLVPRPLEVQRGS